MIEMYTGLIAKRYAEALFRFAVSNGEAEAVYTQVNGIAGHLMDSPELKAAVDSPVLSVEAKRSAVLGAAGDGVCRSLEDFISLVLRHGREHYLIYMFHSFLGIYEERNGIARVSLVTAAPVGEEIEEGIRDMVMKRTACSSVRLEKEVDERLIGGFVLRVADKQMDASVAARLEKLRGILSGKL